jgi:hypothetical protein
MMWCFFVLLTYNIKKYIIILKIGGYNMGRDFSNVNPKVLTDDTDVFFYW